MMVETLQQKGNEIRLFSKNKYYFVNNQWVRYVEKLVNGKFKRTTKVMCIKEISDIYNEIQSVFNQDGVLVASRKTKIEPLKFVGESTEKPPIGDVTQMLRPVNLTVKKLRHIDKFAIRAMLARDNVTYCEFEDIKGQTKIKTSSKGYRLISLIL